jgi:hypothetical protein
MAKTLLLVESKPESAQLVEEYHKWHEQIHMLEMLGVDGLVSARRWQADVGSRGVDIGVDFAEGDEGSNLTAALRDGRMSKPVAVLTQPPPASRYLSLVGEAGR